MKHIRKFNEGIFDVFKKHTPKQIENIKFLKKIKKEIEKSGNIKEMGFDIAPGESQDECYYCVLLSGEFISVTLGGGEFNTPAKIIVRSDRKIRITESEADIKILTDIYNLLKTKLDGKAYKCMKK